MLRFIRLPKTAARNRTQSTIYLELERCEMGNRRFENCWSENGHRRRLRRWWCMVHDSVFFRSGNIGFGPNRRWNGVRARHSEFGLRKAEQWHCRRYIRAILIRYISLFSNVRVASFSSFSFFAFFVRPRRCSFLWLLRLNYFSFVCAASFQLSYRFLSDGKI